MKVNIDIDYEIVHKLALMCRESTCPSIDFSRYGFKYSEVLMSSATDTLAIVCDGRFPTFVFGSEENVWESCLNSFLMPFKEVDPGARIDSTMHGYWTSLRHMVLAKVREFDCEEIVVTGHSTAGAVALLAAADIAKNCPPVKPTAYVFGAPRCGDSRFVRLLQELSPGTIAFEHPGDPVPRMPGGAYASTYLRVGLDHDLSTILRLMHIFPMVGRFFMDAFNEPSVYIDSIFGRIDT